MALSLTTSACGGDGASTDETAASTPVEDAIVAQVASYDLAKERDQRFIVGLFSNEEGVVSFGDADLQFSYLGTESEPLDEPELGPSASASFLPIPGSPIGRGEATRFTSPSEGRGSGRSRSPSTSTV
ncbi:MAG: hypothetical protein OSA99_18380 [Acidimicrobiales bacterium]|nr:hypothetical protein [Acidimicrobiales bacterium]